MNSKQISVIIPTLNRPEDLDRCLASIMTQTMLPSEVIVVDQSDDERTRDLVENYRQKSGQGLPDFVYAHLEQKSSARARNHGIKLAAGDFVGFIDDDIILDPQYFENIIKYFNDPLVGGVAGNVKNPVLMLGFKSRVRKLISRIFLINHFNGRMTASGFGFPIFERHLDHVAQVELFSGYSMIFRRELITENPFDDWFEGYSFREDVDVSYRISAKAKLLQVPDAKFYHNHSSVSRTPLRVLRKMQWRNFKYVFIKHKNKNFYSRILFAYSLSGLLLQDLLEFLLNIRQPEKKQSFAATLSAAKLLMAGKNE